MLFVIWLIGLAIILLAGCATYHLMPGESVVIKDWGKVTCVGSAANCDMRRMVR